MKGNIIDDVEAWQHAHDIAVPAFRTDPLYAWIFMEDGDDEKREDRLRIFFKPVLKSGPICGGYILDARDWGSMMVVTEPGQNYDGLGVILKSGGIPATLSGGRLLFQYLNYLDKVKLKVLPKSRIRDCFFILLAATAALTEYVQDEARKAAKPIWLEATSRYSTNQFQRLGFELVEDIRMGRGKVNAKGKKEAGGEGILITTMIWWPEGVRETFGETG
ncbi:hypothetical protein ACJ41O_004807 [Fusarium nematophilum]